MPPSNIVYTLYPNTTTPVINEITDPFTVVELVIRVPNLDPFTGNLIYTEVNEATLFDFAVAGTAGSATPNALHWVLNFAINNYNNPVWRQGRDESSKSFGLLLPGQNIITKPNIANVDVLLDTVGANVDFWNNDPDFGKYGMLTWGTDTMFNQAQWLNRPNQNFALLDNVAALPGCVITLQPNCSGIYFAYSGFRVPPPVQYSVNGNPFVEFLYPNPL